MQEVARHANVSPATVLNHFPTPDDLAEAVVAELTASIRAPTEDVLAGARGTAAKVRRLARALATFYELTEPWYEIHAKERHAVRALAEGEARFYRDLDRLTRAALGRLASDERVHAGVSAALHPAVFAGLRARGMTADAAGELLGDVLAPWLEKDATSASRRRAS